MAYNELDTKQKKMGRQDLVSVCIKKLHAQR